MKTLYAFLMTALLVVTGTADANSEVIRDENPYALLERVANKTAERISADPAHSSKRPRCPCR